MRTWPLYGLRVTTPRIELRFPDDDDLAELAEAAADGVHDPATMPFAIPWTDAAPPALQQNLLRHHWRQRANWQADEWSCLLVLVVDGEVVGAQDLLGSSFAVTRTVTTGSWLCRRLHRRRLGSEMRAAVLHLAFAGLGAERACSSAWIDNPASLGVSALLGYRSNGRRLKVRRGEAAWTEDLVLDRADWAASRRDDITIEGLEPCLELFGVAPVSDPTSR